MAFDTLKGCLCKAPVLQSFNPELPITMHIDASYYCVGALLLQEEVGEQRVVAYLDLCQKLRKGIV